jgi:hypothetical protein
MPALSPAQGCRFLKASSAEVALLWPGLSFLNNTLSSIIKLVDIFCKELFLTRLPFYTKIANHPSTIG